MKKPTKETFFCMFVLCLCEISSFHLLNSKRCSFIVNPSACPQTPLGTSCLRRSQGDVRCQKMSGPLLLEMCPLLFKTVENPADLSSPCFNISCLVCKRPPVPGPGHIEFCIQLYLAGGGGGEGAADVVSTITSNISVVNSPYVCLGQVNISLLINPFTFIKHS